MDTIGAALWRTSGAPTLRQASMLRARFCAVRHLVQRSGVLSSARLAPDPGAVSRREHRDPARHHAGQAPCGHCAGASAARTRQSRRQRARPARAPAHPALSPQSSSTNAWNRSRLARAFTVSLPGLAAGKADQNGDGRVVTLSEATAGLLLDWIDAAGIEDGPLIQPVYPGTALARHMAGFSISRLLKSIARRAGIDPAIVMTISGHSLRVGAAQTLLGDGHDLLRLMKAGGWKSATTVLRYVDRTEIDVWR